MGFAGDVSTLCGGSNPTLGAPDIAKDEPPFLCYFGFLNVFAFYKSRTVWLNFLEVCFDWHLFKTEKQESTYNRRPTTKYK